MDSNTKLKSYFCSFVFHVTILVDFHTITLICIQGHDKTTTHTTARKTFRKCVYNLQSFLLFFLCSLTIKLLGADQDTPNGIIFDFI